MTSARFGPNCRKRSVSISCFDVSSLNLGSITERNIASLIYRNHFCFFWEINGISVSKAREEVKTNFNALII